MIENIYSAGGRPLFNEDLSAIEDHLKAIQNIFASETPFIISGMQYSGTTASTSITEGYVWLGSRIRYVSAQTIDVSGGAYLESADQITSRTYENNTSQPAVGSYTASTVIGSPTGGNDQLDITDGNSVRRYYANVLGDKFLQLDASDTQTILSNISMQGSFTSSGVITTTSNMTGAIVTATNKMVSTNGYETQSGGLAINPNGTVATNKVVTDSVAPNNITRGHIQDNAIGSDQIDANAVGNSELNANAVSETKMQSNSVSTLKIQDGAVTESKLSNDFKNKSGSIASVPSGFNSIKTVVVEIGGWDMQNDATTSVLTGIQQSEIGNASRVLSASATIVKDNGINIYNLEDCSQSGALSGCIVEYQILGGVEVGVTLQRTVGGFFDSDDFDAPSQNRGYLTVSYLVNN